jgi:hypothetical protein
MTSAPSARPRARCPRPGRPGRHDAEEGPRVAEPGFSGVAPGQRRDQVAAGLGLPPGVDDRAALVADHAVIPLPGLGVDRLADGAEDAQALARGLLDRLLAGAHQRADGGRCGVEGGDIVLVDHLPEARHVRVVRDALEHQRDGAVGERAVDDVGVTGDPADVGGAPVDLAVLVVEGVLVRHGGEDQVAAGGVQHALRLAGGARGVEDEQRVLASIGSGSQTASAHRPWPRGTRCRGPRSRRPRRRCGARRCRYRRSGTPRAPCRRSSSAARCPPRTLSSAVIMQRHSESLDAVAQRIRREAAEDDGVHGADAGAGEHGDRASGIIGM